MADSYTLTIVVQGVDQTAPAVQGMERLGVGGVAAGNLLASAMQQAATAVVGFVGSSISAAGDFQQGMNVLQAASGATAAQMQQMGDLAIALGNDMTLPGASASDAATAMLELSKAGLSVNDTMDAAKGTLQLAAAAETDAATAAGMVAGALNAFGLEGAAASQVADQLAAGANASAASITDLSQGFQAAGFAFNATGQHTDDLITSLAMLTNVGLTGSDAGTALKNAMMQLMAPTDAASATMKQYGINVRDSSGNMLPFRDIIGALQTGLGGLSPAARDAALKTMLMGDGMKAMLPLLNAGVSGFDAMKAKVDQAGAAQAMAAAQMQGFNGALAGVGNAAETLQLVIGQALIPVLTMLFNDAISPAINGITTFAQALFGSSDAFASLGPVAQMAVVALQMLGDMFTALAGEAVAWGSNIIGSLADGMMGAADAVIGILNMIGGMIADLLMPGSPPKLLPGLTDWGAGAIQAYMDGWSQADMSVFNGISDAIKTSLEGIAKASGDKGMNVAGMVLGSQGQIATAINEIHNLGSVSEDTFKSIIASAGPAGPQIAGIMHAYFDLEAATQNVARAQDELNSITAQYAATLDPLKAQLKGIQDQKAAIQDQEKLAKLYAEVADAGTTATQRQLDNLEIQEIQTRQQIRTTEAERDTAVGAAKAKLDAAKQQQDAAKAAVDSQKALIDVQNKGNALVAQQTQAMAGAAGAMKGAGGAMAGMAQATAPLAAAVSNVSGAVRTVGSTVQAAQTAVAATGATFASTAAAIQGVFAPAVAFVQANLAAFQGALVGVGIALAGAFVVLVALPAVLGVIGAVLGVVGAAFAFLLSPIGLLIVGAAALGAAINTNFMGLGTLFAGLIPIFTTIIGVIGQVIAAFGAGGLAGAFAALQAGIALVAPMLLAWGAQLGTVLLSIGQLILTNVLTWGAAFIDWVTPYIAPLLAQLGSFAVSIADWIVAQAPGWAAQLMAWGLAFVDWITPYAALAITTLGGWLAGLWAWIVAQAPGFIAQLAAWGAAFIAWIGPMIGPAVAALGDLASAFFNWIVAQAAPILAQLGAWAQSFVAWIGPATVQFLAAWPGMLSGFLDWIASAVGPLLAKLGDWAIAFVQWIAPMIPGFLEAVAGIAAALLVWIGETVGVLAGKLIEWGAAFIGWVAPKIPGILAAIGDIALKIIAWIGEVAPKIVAKLLEWGKAFVEWVAPLIGKIPGAMEGIKTAVSGWISSAATSLAKSAADIGKNIVSGIISGVSSMGTALADKLKSMAKSALDAAKSALGIHSPSAVMAQQIGVPIVDGIVAGLGAASPKLTGKMLELAGQMVDLVSKGVDAFGKLRDLGSISMGAISQFVQTLQDTMTLFGEMTLKWDRGMMSAAGQFTGKSEKVVDFLAKGIDFLLKLQTFQGVPQAIIHTFADNLSQAITELIRISTWQIRLALTAAVEFSTGAGKVLEVLSKGVDGLNKLRTMAAPIPGSFAAFALYTLVVVTRMSEVASQIDGAAVASAGRFADGAGKVLGILSSGVDGLTKLATLGAPVPGMFQSFAVQVFAIVLRISEVAGWLSTEAVTAAATFADGAGKVIGIIGSGVEAFTKLAKVAAVPESALTTFAETLRQTMVQFSIISSGWTADMIAQAGAFAEGAGKAVAVLSNGVDGFAKLATFASIPDAALTVFAEALRQTMVQFSIISTGWTTEMIAAAGAFADGAGKVLGSIKNGVDGLTALRDLGPVSQAGLNAFATAVQELMTRLTTIAVQFSAEGVAAAGAFSDAAGKAVGILKNGIEGLLLLNTFTGTSVDAMTRFGDGVRLAVAKMAELAAEFGTDAIAAATAFANAAGQSTDFLKKGVEGFLKLADFKAIPQQSMDLFAAGVVSLINTIIQLSGVLSTDALAQANTFSNAIDTVITVVLSGLKALSDLGNQAAGIKSFTDALIGQVNVLAQALASQARPAAMNIGFNIALGIADGITAGAGAIQNAIFAAVNQALAAARAALGIASPSAVFRDQIGMQMSAGMAEGVMGGMGGVQAAVGQVASGALTAGQGPSTTNNNQRSISIAPGAIVIQGAGQNADAIGDAVVRRLELAIGGRLA